MDGVRAALLRSCGGWHSRCRCSLEPAQNGHAGKKSSIFACSRRRKANDSSPSATQLTRYGPAAAPHFRCLAIFAAYVVASAAMVKDPARLEQALTPANHNSLSRSEPFAVGDDSLSGRTAAFRGSQYLSRPTTPSSNEVQTAVQTADLRDVILGRPKDCYVSPVLFSGAPPPPNMTIARFVDGSAWGITTKGRCQQRCESSLDENNEPTALPCVMFAFRKMLRLQDSSGGSYSAAARHGTAYECYLFASMTGVPHPDPLNKDDGFTLGPAACLKACETPPNSGNSDLVCEGEDADTSDEGSTEDTVKIGDVCRLWCAGGQNTGDVFCTKRGLLEPTPCETFTSSSTTTTTSSITTTITATTTQSDEAGNSSSSTETTTTSSSSSTRSQTVFPEGMGWNIASASGGAIGLVAFVAGTSGLLYWGGRDDFGESTDDYTTAIEELQAEQEYLRLQETRGAAEAVESTEVQHLL